MDNIIQSLINILANVLSTFKIWAQDVILYIVDFVLSGLLQVFQWVFDIILWVLDKAALLCTGYGLDTSASWSGVPATTIHVLYQVNIISIIQILICAIMVRMLLNLIPSWASRI